MQYNGGKKRIAKRIAALINMQSPSVYWEPFCGMCSVACVVNAETVFCSDLDQSVISLLCAVQQGWDPPVIFSEEEYHAARVLPETNPLHAFAKFGCSFAGKPWGGYARSGHRNYALNARNALLKMRPALGSVQFVLGSYLDLADSIRADVLYCDPPYANTTSVGMKQVFDLTVFWSWVRGRREIVFVSEYSAPAEFKCIFQDTVTDGLVPKQGMNVERLWVRYSDLSRLRGVL